MDLDKDWEKIKTNVQELIKSVSRPMRVSRTAYGSDRRAQIAATGLWVWSPVYGLLDKNPVK